MPEPVDPREKPKQVIDGLRIADTDTSDRYTVTVRDDGSGLTIARLDGSDVRQPTAEQLQHWLRTGDYYVPEYGPFSDVLNALDALAEDGDPDA